MYEFYYQSLNDKEKRLYDNFLKGVKYHYPEIFVSFQCNDNEIENVFRAVLYDHPELYFLNLSWKYKADRGGTTIAPQYTYKPDEIVEIDKRIKAKFEKVFARVINSKDEFAKVLMVHDYICTTVKYDAEADTSFNILGPFFKGHSACQGIAMMAKYLFDYIGIKSIFIYGKAVGEGHSEGHGWNKVMINGNWYNIDITFDLRRHGCLQYTYFNVTDQEISYDHVIETENSPACISSQDNYFHHQGLVFASVRDAASYFNEKLQTANYVSFRLKDSANIDHTQEVLDAVEFDIKRGLTAIRCLPHIYLQVYLLTR